MKPLYSLSLTCYPLLLTLLLAGCHHPASMQKTAALQSLLDNKEYFKLRTALALYEDSISEDKSRWFHAFADNAFNRNAASTDNIRALLKEDASTLPDSLKARLLMLEEDNEFKTFQYARAAAIHKDLIDHYRHAVDSSTYADIKNTAIITGALAAEPAQEVVIPTGASIPWKKDRIGLMEIPLGAGDSVYQAIFDTRANISSISETYAKKLGIKLLNVSYTEGSGATGNEFKVSLGLADSFRLGNILFRHVVFQVMPDTVLYLAPIDFHLNIIVGYPVIAQLKEIHIFRNGVMTIPIHPSGSNLNNLALDGLDPVVSCEIGTDTLCFKFDTGASSSDLYDNYFSKYRTEVTRRGKATTIKVGGAGGVTENKVYEIDAFTLTIGSKTVTLPKVSVHMDPIPNSTEKFYGNLGQDIVVQFPEMILNFESMYLDFK
ncbi:MAG TPA: pepsin/retropepsin-like aspartic protease family protein [Puia sp.]|nr:pepsin/retropepsin-like aspartic protease family protein [Puia sp.]